MAGLTISKICEATNLSRDYVLRRIATGELAEHVFLRKDGKRHGHYRRSILQALAQDQPSPTATTEASIEGGGDARVVVTKSASIRTVEDALAYAEVNTDEWEVERFLVNSWEMGFKARKEMQEDGVQVVTPGTQKLWQVKVWIRRRVRGLAENITDLCLQRIAAAAPAYPKRRYAVPKDPHLLEVSLFDHHIGSLAWARETGQNYDLNIAIALYERAIEELLCKAAPYPIERILFPIGSDFFHIDSLTNTTTGGTPQDTDGRLAKIVETGEAALVKAIDRMLTVAPVHVMLVAGNHDRVTSWHSARYLSAYYSRCDAVTVDCEPRLRKYLRYGPSLIGFTHEPLKNLALLMPTEQPQEWAATAWHEWHTGHLHHKRATETVPVSSHNGVVMRVLPSLAATNAWHYQEGFVGNRTAEAYLWSKAAGPSGYVCTSAGAR
jgi:hypothetical protein